MPLLSDDDFGVVAAPQTNTPTPKLLSDEEFGVSAPAQSRVLSDDEFGVGGSDLDFLKPIPGSPTAQWQSRFAQVSPEDKQHLSEQLTHPDEMSAVADKAGAAWDFVNRGLWPEAPKRTPEEAQAEINRETAHPVEMVGGVPMTVAPDTEDQQDFQPPKFHETAAAGALDEIGDLARGLTSPLGIATLGTGALSETAQRAVSATFAGQMFSQLPEQAQQLHDELSKPAAQRDEGKIGRLITAGIANLGFGTLSASHALAPGEMGPSSEQTPEVRAAPAAVPAAPANEAPAADTSPCALADLQAALQGNQMRMPGRDMLAEFRRKQAQAPAAEEGQSGTIAPAEANLKQNDAGTAQKDSMPEEAPPLDPESWIRLNPDAGSLDIVQAFPDLTQRQAFDLKQRVLGPTLTEPAEGEKTVPAAPETETGGTGESVTPTTSTPAEKAAPLATTQVSETIPVEGGEIPSRSAAGSRTGTYTNYRPHDIIDEVEGTIGHIDPTLIKEANPDWKPIGAARKIFKTGGQPADTAADALFQSGIFKGDPGQVDQLGDAINDAANARKGFRAQQSLEKKQTTRDAAFARDVSRPGVNQRTIVADDLQPGDTLRIRGAPFKVREFEFDQDGNVVSVTMDDGAKYGTQRVEGGTEIMYDNRTFKRGKEDVVTQPTAKGTFKNRVAQEGESGTPRTKDPVMDWLNNAIEKTDPLKPLREGEVGMAFPKWATQTLIHSALKVVRAAYAGGRRLAAAVQEGVEFLRKQNLPGFDADEAHVTLLKAMHSGEGQTPLSEIEARREAIGKRLDEINATQKRPGNKLPPELRSERYRLVKEARGLERERVTNPDYVRDVFSRMEKLTNDLQIANQAGNGLHARQLVDELQSIMDSELPRIPEDLKKRVYDEMVAKGEILKSQMKELPGGRTLDDLTSWLKANGADSPGVPIKDRLNLFKRLADDYNRGKDKLANAWGRLRAGWEAFKAQYKSPPVDDNFRSLMKDWFFEKQWTGLETHKWVQEIRDAVPQRMRREAIGAWLDAHGDEQLLRSQADMVPERYRQIWETALRLTEKEKVLARRVQLDFEQKLSDGQGLGLIDRGRAEYGLPQLWKVKPKYEGEFDPEDPQWKRPQTPRNPGAKLDPRDPFFALQRTVPSYFDGIMAGGSPVSLDVGDLVGHYNAEFHDALADRGVIKNLKDAKAADGKPIVQISGGARIEPRDVGQRTYFVDSNWRPKDALTADGRPYRTIDHWALRGWKFAGMSEEGNPILVNGDFLVHPDHYSFLKNELGKSILRDPDGPLGDFAKVTNALLNSTVFLKGSKFASATFHMATLAEHSMFHAFAGLPSRERLALLSPSTRGVELDPARDPELARLMRAGTNLGFDGSRELFEEGLAGHGGLWSKVPGLGDVMTRLSDFLFKSYMPALKAKTAKVFLHANLERYAGDIASGKISQEQVYEQTAQQANAAFGAQQNKLAWTALGRNKTLMDVNRLLFTAPDFLVSRLKVLGQALKPYNAEQRYFILAQAALVYTGARVINAIFRKDHDPMWDPRLWDKVVLGDRAYSARFLVSDYGHLIQDPVDFAAGRVGPYPKMAIDALVQRDWRTGSRLSVPIETDNRAVRAAEIMAKDFGSWLLPMGAEGFAPGAPAREQTKVSQAAQALAGIGSRKYSAETQLYDAAAKFNRNSGPAGQSYQKARDAEARVEGQYRKLDDLLDAGDVAGARKEYNALRAEGHTDEGFLRHFADRPFTGNAARELQFKQSLSPAEQQQYQAALQTRQTRRENFGKMVRASNAVSQPDAGTPAPAE